MPPVWGSGKTRNDGNGNGTEMETETEMEMEMEWSWVARISTNFDLSHHEALVLFPANFSLQKAKETRLHEALSHQPSVGSA